MRYLVSTLTSIMEVGTCVIKNRWLKIRTILVIGFVLLSGLADAQNLLTNPGFETGNTSGWFAFGPPTLSVETSQVHSGVYACLVTNRTDTLNGVAQSLVGILQPGQTYAVSAWLRVASGGNQTMQLTMQKTDGSGTAYAAIASGRRPLLANRGAWLFRTTARSLRKSGIAGKSRVSGSRSSTARLKAARASSGRFSASR